MRQRNKNYSKHSPRLLNLFQGKITPSKPREKYETPTKNKNQKTLLKSVLDDIWKSKLKNKETKTKKTLNLLGKRSWAKEIPSVDLTEKTPQIAKKATSKMERLQNLEIRYKQFEENYFKSYDENCQRDAGKLSCFSKFTSQESSQKIEKTPEISFENLNKKKISVKNKKIYNGSQYKNYQEYSPRILQQRNQDHFNNRNLGKRSVDGAIYKKLKTQINNNSFNRKKQRLLKKLEDSLKELKANTPEKYRKNKELAFSSESEEKEPQEEQVKCFTAYAARTNMGLYRDYNEDRVSIIVNILLEINERKTQNSSFFALFDGHAGSKCADFLKDKLHFFITNQKEYIDDKLNAIRKGIFKAEEEFWKEASSGPVIDISGSCLLMSIFHENACYFANVGDSRAVLSSKKGKEIKQLTTDHKPEDEIETNRIKTNGGDVFRNRRVSKKMVKDDKTGEYSLEDVTTYGPFRVHPGGLSVSRTIGDIPSKDPKLGGAQSCVVPTPELGKFEVNDTTDFLVLACDGVYDVLSNEDVVNAVWESIERCAKFMSLEEVARIASENVMKASFDKRSMDNITVIVILFKEKEYYLNGRKEKVFF